MWQRMTKRRTVGLFRSRVARKRRERTLKRFIGNRFLSPSISLAIQKARRARSRCSAAAAGTYVCVYVCVCVCVRMYARPIFGYNTPRSENVTAEYRTSLVGCVTF